MRLSDIDLKVYQKPFVKALDVRSPHGNVISGKSIEQ